VSTIAKNSTKSVKSRGRNQTQPLEQDAALPSTLIGETIFGREAMLKCTFILLACLSREMMSQDVWVLAMLSAQKKARDLGIEDSDLIMEFIAELISEGRSGSFTGRLDRAGFF
jgi:hypothetical protein